MIFFHWESGTDSELANILDVIRRVVTSWFRVAEVVYAFAFDAWIIVLWEIHCRHVKTSVHNT